MRLVAVHFLLDHLAGVLRPISPWRWMAVVRGRRAAEGWIPPMMLLAAAFMLLGVKAGFGLLGAELLVKAFNYVAVATWLLVASTASIAVGFDAFRNLRRFGLVGLSRPRWWFELGRLGLVGGLVIFLTLLLLNFAGGAAVRRIADPFFGLPLALLITFLVSTTVGYALSEIVGRARRGRAFECVEYFYLLSIAIIPVTALVVALPAGAPWLRPATVAGCVAAAAVIVIGLVAVGRGMQDRTNHDEAP